jgi:hypothetical protein
VERGLSSPPDDGIEMLTSSGAEAVERGLSSPPDDRIEMLTSSLHRSQHLRVIGSNGTE